MEKKLNEMTPEEEGNYINKINEDFNYFLNAIPFVERGDTTNGQFQKLRVQLNEDASQIADIMFELQWKLYIYKKRYPKVSKMIVSDLQITSKIPNTAFRRGFMIKIKYK